MRDPTDQDEAAWRELWIGYNEFYQAIVSEDVTRHTWKRIMDPQTSMFARLADDDGRIIGFSIAVVHEGTWVLRPICYLEDLFVRPESRGQGVGALLLDDMINRAKSQNCARIYWHTREGNPARKLYDRFASADDFVRYSLTLEPPKS